ncbi:MAG TPA: PAS domain-containing sensor histidine kinase, partial [Magnetospirillum sp.]|nr:PAS domain-containing sensor histidine kinase [Magnetospirillum sp.]
MRTEWWTSPLPWTLGAAVSALAGMAAAESGPLLLPVGVAALTALAATGVLARRWGQAREAAAQAHRLAGALDSEMRACVIIDADKREIYRNVAGRRMLGAAADPLAPFMARAAGDDRTLAELERLQAAAL